MDFKIGVMLESFRLADREAIEAAAKIGAQGIQMYCTKGDHAPENMTADKKKELLSLMDANGLVFSAICGDLGMGFGKKELNPGLIEKSKRILELAKELGTDIVTTHVGVVPASPDHDRYKIMQEACFELSRFADSLGSHFAIETGPEPAKVLRGFLDSLGSRGVAVNLDPANLVMVTGDDPVAAVDTLAPYIVHTHAKDGVKLLDNNPEQVYGIVDEVPTGRGFEEVALGTGMVDFPKYLANLDKIGFRGFLTIEREVGDNPAKDIKTAADFLRGIIGQGAPAGNSGMHLG